MKKTNDINIYIILMTATLVVSAFFAGISLYSIASVEPEVRTLLETDTNSNGEYEDAYLILRSPQLFAAYGFWDAEGTSVRNTMRYFDSKIYRGLKIKADEKVYLELLLKRRESGARLGMKSALFFFLLSIAGFIAFIIEKKEIRED